MNTKNRFAYPLLALGFRAFFLLAGLSALMLILLWNAIFKGDWVHANYFAANGWHAHEMLLGYSVAVVAGFLLTAVKNWTGQPTVSGDQLLGLCLLWLYGRILPFYAGLLPDTLIAVVDFAFLPLLAYHVSKPVLRTRQYRNLVFIGILLLLALGNGLIHAQTLGLLETSANLGTELVLATLIVLILVIAGRIYPFFTERAISGTLIIKNPLLEAGSIASAVLVFALQMAGISGGWLASAAVIAASANLARIVGWYVPRIRYVPLLWVLYIGYVWIIAGFILTALAAYALIPASLALHAFTVGGIAVVTLGMMARVALGHTGRALRVSNAIALAFVLINIAALLRVILPIALPNGYDLFVYASSLCWLAAFALFVFIYLPILTQARIDGQEG
ncbi:MAG: NnrS family protein [Methylovulum sp.]|uniref:NnrS family protein n=1 Tax=Methylovulum sp. TaxID=1916980 RepID=UPI002604E705|nr:NnrS family protein [Methylovulum sp.]MDD2724279.1 NnrS family protein [Methylovulum sp.]MDD5122988.1 NnrS family protein [Methylovulum sp.]